METILSGDKQNLITDESSSQNSCNEKEANSSHANGERLSSVIA